MTSMPACCMCSGECNACQGVGAWQAVDLQPEEPATVAQHSAHTSLRERLLRFNVAVLRIVAAACAGLPDSKQASRLCCICTVSALRRTLPETAQSSLLVWPGLLSGQTNPFHCDVTVSPVPSLSLCTSL